MYVRVYVLMYVGVCCEVWMMYRCLCIVRPAHHQEVKLGGEGVCVCVCVCVCVSANLFGGA